MKSLSSDNDVEAHSSHYPAPRHSYAGDTWNDAVAVGHRLIRSLAIGSGVEICSSSNRWYLHLPGTATSTVSGRHRDTNRLMTCTYEEFARQGPLSPRIDPFFRWSRGSSDFFRQPPASARL